MKTFYNDLLDYSDIEDIAELPPSLQRGDKIFQEELWNQINRRGEKVKISLLRSIDEKVVKILNIVDQLVGSIGLKNKSEIGDAQGFVI
jgi:hypothetical protein